VTEYPPTGAMATVDGPVEERALRADARRNLERILEAACDVFAEHGIEASVADVADRAQVGTATIFRRFPTKQALVAAVLEKRMGDLLQHARDALTRSDPGRALRDFMRLAVDFNVRDRGFCEAGEKTAAFSDPSTAALVDELVQAIGDLLARAQEVGAARKDVKAVDVLVLLFSVAESAALLEAASPGIWRRYLDLVLDGLRPEGAHPLSRRAPTRSQLEAAKARVLAEKEVPETA
jgi:AcrR family transcriptional regulator